MSKLFTRCLMAVCAAALAACQTAPGPDVPEQPVEEAPPACECPSVEVEPPSCPPVITPQPPVAEPCIQPAPVTQSSAKMGQGLLIIGRVEYAFVKREGSTKAPLKLKARIDTGAGLSSMHAHNLVAFERDGDPWVRFGLLQPKTEQPVFFERPVKRYVSIKLGGGETERRPVVRMSVMLGSAEESVEVSLTDRSDYIYQVLIGRNFLRDRAVVDVRRKFIADDGFHQTY